MERIGIAASKMAKGNLWLYNLWVVIISFVFSLFIFVVAGSSIALSLLIIGAIIKGTIPTDYDNEWFGIIRICMMMLTLVVGLFNLTAILKNFRLKKR